MHLLVTDPEAVAAARSVVDAELDAIELAASRFRPDSEVCALADAGGARVPVSPVLADLIAAALAAARATDGDVDPTVGSALVALGYDGDISRVGTALPRIASVTVPVDWTAVEFDGQSVRMPAGTLLDLGATKVTNGDGRAVYVLPADASHDTGIEMSRLARAAHELVVSVDHSVNIVVVRTPPGGAQYLASAFDGAHWGSILGTVAGDDTVLIVTRGVDAGAEVAEAILAMAEGRAASPPSSGRKTSGGKR